MTAPTRDERAVERITIDYPVEVLSPPTLVDTSHPLTLVAPEGDENDGR